LLVLYVTSTPNFTYYTSVKNATLEFSSYVDIGLPTDGSINFPTSVPVSVCQLHALAILSLSI